MRLSKKSIHFPKLNDEAWVRDCYETRGMTMKEIAHAAGGCSAALVLHAMRRFGIDSRKGKKAIGHRKGGGAPQEFPQLRNREWLQARRDEGMSATEIARLLGCSFSLACRAVREMDANKPEPEDFSKSPYYGQKMRLNDAAWLRDQYILHHREAQSIADEIGATVWGVQSALGRFRILKFPKRNQEKQDPSLPQGIKRTSKGYLKIYMPSHPHAGRMGYVYHHRVVAESVLGRYLTFEESVHHLNLKTDDNRPENLLVMSSYKDHMRFHKSPPDWIPRCECCQKPRPEILQGRPADVPILWVWPD